MKPAGRVLALAIASSLLTGCASRVMPIGPGYVFQPDEREQRLWRATESMSEELQASGKLYQDPALEAYVQGVLDRLLAQDRSAYAPLKLRVRLLDAPSVNAFALPQGDMYLHTGILGRVRSEAQLAMVLGHELTHSTHRHTFQIREQAYASSGAYAYASVLSAIGGGNIQNAVSALGELMAMAAISGYGRDKESEADRTGLTLIAQAGYDPRDGARMFERMLEATDKRDRGWNFFYATHPRMKERVVDCRELAGKLSPELLAHATEIGRERFVEAAGKLIYDEVERHVAQGKYALAEQTLAYLADVKPNPLAHAYLGDVMRAKAGAGDAARARESYETALSMDAGCAAAYRGLGLLLASSGDKAGAVIHLRRYLECADGAADAAYIRQYVEQLSRGD